MKLLEENIWNTLQDIDPRKNFQNSILSAQETSPTIVKWVFIKSETPKGSKTQLREKTAYRIEDLHQLCFRQRDTIGNIQVTAEIKQ